MTTTPPFPREWLDRLTPAELERLAIRTVDGGLSDADALVAEGLVRKVWEAKAKERRDGPQ